MIALAFLRINFGWHKKNWALRPSENCHKGETAKLREMVAGHHPSANSEATAQVG
jgi:hypothetical protein